MKGSIDYCLQKFKTVDTLTGKRYVSGINCNGLNAYKEFMTTKFANNANNGRYFYQYVQSFSLTVWNASKYANKDIKFTE